MSDISKIAVVKELLDTAFLSLQNARKVMAEVTGSITELGVENFSKQALAAAGSMDMAPEGERIIEGVFNGQEMIGSDASSYPVPVNYASKSKLVSGDHLKLTIKADGRFLYKQIGPIDRKYIVGPLTYEEGQYQVLTEGKIYKVLLASVTYFKAEVGDEITVIIPSNQETEWAAIDAVLPKVENVIIDDTNIEEKE
jgi:hypothetical protein